MPAMLHLADLLASIPLPPLAEDAPPVGTPTPAVVCADESSLLQELGGDLPAGHLHVWGGPSGAGKTAFLLCLLHSAATRGRRVVYASYDLAPESLAVRMLAKAAGIDRAHIPDPRSGAEAASSSSSSSSSAAAAAADACTLDADALARAHAARAYLATLPFEILPARGFSARSLNDRLVRMPFRPEVLAVDYLQGVVREPDSDMGGALRDLSDMAAHLHVAVVCAVRAADTAGGGLEHPSLSELAAAPTSTDRIGWLAPHEPEQAAAVAAAGSRVAAPSQARTETGAPLGNRRAEVLRNKHGAAPSVPLHLDSATGSFERPR